MVNTTGQFPAFQEEATAQHAKVFTLDPGRFYINRKGSRFPIVNTIRLKDETFSGPTTDYAPDMVAATAPGYYFKSFDFHRTPEVKVIEWEGNHVWNDAFMYAPHPIVEGYQPMIWDILPTALTAMGMTLPGDLDGRDIAAPGIREQKVA